MNTLIKGEQLILTEKGGDIHHVILNSYDETELSVNFTGFGQLVVKWDKVQILEKMTLATVNSFGSYSAKFKKVIYLDQA